MWVRKPEKQKYGVQGKINAQFRYTGRVKLAFLCLLVLTRLSRGWMMPTHTGEGSTDLFSLPIQMLTFSSFIPVDIPRNHV